MNRDLQLYIECALAEKLVMHALERGAQFSRIRRCPPRGLRVEADEASISILTQLCRRYGLNCRLERRGGISALRRRIRQRWTLVFSALVCIVVCALFLTRLWLVEVRFTGPCADLGDEARIHEFLAQSNIRPGMPAGDIDTELLQAALLAHAGDYSYAGVRLRGVHLLVELSPEVPAPETHEISRARDLVAARDGVVESIAVYAGSACVQPGDTVRRGQLLIRGEETVGTDPESGDEITAPVRALGEVRARCWLEGSAEGRLSAAVSLPTGRRQTDVRLRLGGLCLDVRKGAGFESEILQLSSVPVVGLYLPLMLERVHRLETRTEIRPCDPAALEAQLGALARADALRAAARLEYETASAWTDAQRNENTLRVRAVYEIYTNIAVSRDAYIEEVN